VAFLDKKIGSIIHEILRNSPNSVIIIQGDHGPGADFLQEDLINSDIDQKFSILNSYYFADKEYSMISEDITPVNTFRVILNKYFGTGLPMLENRSYWSDYQDIYSFEDITNRLR